MIILLIGSVVYKYIKKKIKKKKNVHNVHICRQIVIKFNN